MPNKAHVGLDDGLKVGTEAIEVLFPRLFIDLVDLEKERKFTPGTITSQDGSVGNIRAAVMDAYQNPVTLGATLVHRTMEKYKLQPDDIAGLIVGTESSPDEAVAINCRIVGALEQLYGEGSLRHWGLPEIKATCAGTGFGNYFAQTLFWSGEIDEYLKILSLATDDAKYGLISPGESTRGSGTTLEIIGTNPIWAAERRLTTRTILNEYGFSRPFGELYPKVISKESLVSYNYVQRDGVDGWKEKAIKKGVIKLSANDNIFNYVQRVIPHPPYFVMPKSLAVFLFRHELRNVPEVWKPILQKIGVEKEPAHDGKGSIETIMKDEQLWREDKIFREKIKDTEEFKKFFEGVFSLSLNITPQVGNLYNGSLGIGKRSLLETAYKKNIDLTGERHAFGYFGSGAIGLAQTAIVMPRWKDVAKDYHTLDELEQVEEGGLRHKIEIKTYERLNSLKPDFYDNGAWVLDPENEFIVSDVDDNGNLRYKFVG